MASDRREVHERLRIGNDEHDGGRDGEGEGPVERVRGPTAEGLVAARAARLSPRGEQRDLLEQIAGRAGDGLLTHLTASTFPIVVSL
jgi:hypothetical protein